MKDYEKQIEDVAVRYSAIIESVSTQDFNEERCIDDYIEGAKSDAAKEFHQQGIYSQEQLLSFADYVYKNYDEQFLDLNELFVDWVEENKKKETLDEDIYEVRFKVCPIGSYEVENKVADCVGSDNCRELCKKHALIVRPLKTADE